jgi:hypothetical protein
MNMPGFTAETSLYKTSGHYRMARTVNAIANGQKIIPQRVPLCEVEPECLQACFSLGYARDCWFICCH